MKRLLGLFMACILLWSFSVCAQEYRSIYEIQTVYVGDDASYMEGEIITTSGIVTAGAGLFYAGSHISFYLQDSQGGPWSGILIFDEDNSAFATMIGDSVLVTGTVSEYRTFSGDSSMMTEIVTIGAPMTIMPGRPLPEIIVLDCGMIDSTNGADSLAEQYEGCLVQVRNVLVSDISSPYAQFKVTDLLTGDCIIRMYSDSLQSFGTPSLGTLFESITGVVYSVYGNYTLMPRTAADLVLAEGPPIITGTNWSPGGHPMSDDTVSVYAYLYDDSMIEEAAVFYRVNGGGWMDLVLEPQGEITYRALIMPQTDNSEVDFYVYAIDDEDNEAFDPPDAPNDFYTYTVSDSVAVFDWTNLITATGETGTAPNEFSVIFGGGSVQNFLPAPPPPPQYLTWMELYEANWVSGPYAEMTFVWPPEDTTVWLLSVDPNGNVMPPVSRTTVVSWNPVTLPASGTYYIEEYFTGNVMVADMRAVSSFQTSGIENNYYNLIFEPGPVLEPHFTIAPDSYDFGSIQAGISSAPVTFTVTNDGTADGSGVILLDNTADFNISLSVPYDLSLPVGESLEFTAEFVSQSPVNEMKEGTISVLGDNPANDLFCDLQGFTYDSSWILPVTVTGEAGTAPNEFTVTIGGQLEESFLPAPPPPPQYLAWTELYEPDWAGGPYAELVYLWPFTGNMTWLIAVDPNGNVAPPVSRAAMVSWESYGLPEQGDFYITEYFSGTVVEADMRVDSTFLVTGIETQYFNIHYSMSISEPVQDLTISIIGGDAVLDWEDVPGASMYNIYRSEDTPYFDINGMIPYATSSVSDYTDTEAVSAETVFYIVTWE